jgi:hypothetical protein
MTGNVMTWEEAIRKGYEPKLYLFSSKDVPLGTFEAILDYKIWAKKIMAICCYFTEKNTAKKFQLTVYCDRNQFAYKIGSCETDFVCCPVGQTYEICLSADEKKKILFKSARQL